MFNATFKNVSVISWQSVLLVEETGVPQKPTNLPQYPKEIADRRRDLVPKLKQYKRQGRQAKIVDDRHIVDDVHFPGGDPPRREEQAMDNYW